MFEYQFIEEIYNEYVAVGALLFALLLLFLSHITKSIAIKAISVSLIAVQIYITIDYSYSRSFNVFLVFLLVYLFLKECKIQTA